MKARLRDESGLSLIELLISMLMMAFVMTAVAMLFSSGLRATFDSQARVAGQGDVRNAITRLEYEARCASGATVSGGGSTVTMTLPSECSHGVGTYTWCVTGAELVRSSGSSCLTTGTVLATSVTTPTPFSLLTASGYLPRLQITLTVNQAGAGSTNVSVTDVVTLRNASRT